MKDWKLEFDKEFDEIYLQGLCENADTDLSSIKSFITKLLEDTVKEVVGNKATEEDCDYKNCEICHRIKGYNQHRQDCLDRFNK